MEMVEIVSTVGFPIASFLMSAYFIKYTFDKREEKDKDVEEREEKRWSVLSDLTASINNNTAALRQLVDKIESGERYGSKEKE